MPPAKDGGMEVNMRKNIGKFLCVAVTSALVVSGSFAGSMIWNTTSLADDDGTDDADSEDDDEDDEDDEVEVALSDCKVTFDKSSFAYTGKAIKPEVTVSYVDSEGDEVDLEEDEDYEITYSNNKKVSKNAKITIEGISDECTGTITKTFTISKAVQKISAKNVSVSLAKSTYKLKAKCSKGDGKLSYASSKSAIASVSSAGKLTLHKKGITTITITAKGTANYKVTKKKIVVNVK